MKLLFRKKLIKVEQGAFTCYICKRETGQAYWNEQTQSIRFKCSKCGREWI